MNELPTFAPAEDAAVDHFWASMTEVVLMCPGKLLKSREIGNYVEGSIILDWQV